MLEFVLVLLVLAMFSLPGGVCSDASAEDSEKKYRLLFENMSAGFALCQVVGDSRSRPSDFKLVEVNPAFTRITGIRPCCAAGKTLREVLPDLGDHCFDTLEHVVRTGQPAASHCYSQTLDKYLDAWVFVIDKETCALLFNDVTDRILAEDEKRRLERDLEEQKWQFYRETILCVTEGKLDLCGESDVLEFVAGAELVLAVKSPAEVGAARRDVEAFAREYGLSGQDLDDYGLAVGEGLTNAVKHAGACQLHAGADPESVWVAIIDHGGGIDSPLLPNAVLQPGFSTGCSLGVGYTIMLKTTDRILLNTRDGGTRLVLIKRLAKAAATPGLDELPDTWDSLTDI